MCFSSACFVENGLRNQRLLLVLWEKAWYILGVVAVEVMKSS